METTSQILEQTPFRQARSLGRFVINHLACGAWGDLAESLKPVHTDVEHQLGEE